MMPDLAFADPRNSELGIRVLVPEELAPKLAGVLGAEFLTADDYEQQRIVCGVPKGGADFAYGDAFPHEANMDRLEGISFDKGCYVGQEVVSRMQHRGTARTRILPLAYVDGFTAEPGVDVTAGGKVIGKTGTGAEGRGLAMVRVDRVADALAAGETIYAGGLPVEVRKPDWIRFEVPGTSQ